jgi:methylmalonyl-CoA/ethylmalonyl-CoA epimerase
MERQLTPGVGVRDDTVVAGPRLTLDHIGVLVKELEHARTTYRQLGARISEPVSIASQGVRVCFVDMPGAERIELVEPIESGAARDLLKRGITYYHLGYIVPDFDSALASLECMNYFPLETFRSEAFHGRRCTFLMSPVRHLIEIIEQG